MSLNLFIGILILFILMALQIIVIFFFNIEVKKRRILLVFDFLAILLIYSGFLLWIAVVKEMLFIPFVLLFFIVYNIILFKIIKRFILLNRLRRIKEEINDALIESLKSLAELDYKSAYEILDDAIQRYPDSIELLNLRTLLEKRLKIIKPDKIKEQKLLK